MHVRALGMTQQTAACELHDAAAVVLHTVSKCKFAEAV